MTWDMVGPWDEARDGACNEDSPFPSATHFTTNPLREIDRANGRCFSMPSMIVSLHSVDYAACSTTFSQPSSLARNISYPRAASDSGKRCVTTKLGSISPRSIRSSSGFM